MRLSMAIRMPVRFSTSFPLWLSRGSRDGLSVAEPACVRVKLVLLPARSPNLNVHIERFVRSLKEECLERLIFFGESSLHAATANFLDHFHSERNHQGIGNRLIIPGNEVGQTVGEIACRERLGGTLKYYYRKAA
jgi:transposase InsO family protein